MGLTQTVAPTLQPVSLAEAKTFLRVEYNDDDGLIQTLIEAATDQAQTITSRQFMTATYTHTLDRFETIIFLPRPPLGSVSSIQYVDLNGDTQTESSSIYTVISDQIQAFITEAFNQSWSATRNQPNAVTITYTAGYGTEGSDVPEPIRYAIKMFTLDLYENRSSKSEVRLQDNDAASRLLWPFRSTLFV